MNNEFEGELNVTDAAKWLAARNHVCWIMTGTTHTGALFFQALLMSSVSHTCRWMN